MSRSRDTLHSDAITGSDQIAGKLDTITVDVIQQMEKTLDPYDIISLVFLLYHVPDTALQRLIIYQRVSKDIEGNNMSLLYDWAIHAQSRPTWRHEFLEALVVCQLYGVVRNLGLDVSKVKEQFLTDDLHANFYINPIKKVLYKLCENIDSENLNKLKKTFNTYQLKTSEYESFELVLLELMSQKIINIHAMNKDLITLSSKNSSGLHLETFIKIIEKFPSLKKFAFDLRELEMKQINNSKQEEKLKKESVTQLQAVSEDDSTQEDKDIMEFKNSNVMDEIFNIIREHIDDDVNNLESDATKKVNKDVYPIKNKERPGICYIINQEEFHLSKESIDNQEEPLANRCGSSKDKEILRKTMETLNYKVIIHDNLESEEMLQCIKDIVGNEVRPDDSVFMLCILSHGVRGHIYAADSVKVSIDDIQNLLDSKYAKPIHNIPKVLIIQACQDNISNDKKALKLIADAPIPNFHVKKSQFFIYWATAPELMAYRYGQCGSIFIHILCKVIAKKAKLEQFSDLCTLVNNMIENVSKTLRINQVPEYKSSLSKKLYLQSQE